MPVWPVPYCKHFNPANKTLKHGADSLPRLIRRTAAAVADTAAPAPALGLQNKKKTAAVFKRFVCRMWCVHIIVRYIYIYEYICAGLLLPKLVELFNCSDVTVANFTAQNRCGPEAFDDQTIFKRY
eukprot:COSAG06_NODE_10908_length_1598_cov_1.166111_1_plen_126_part_00